MIPVAIGDAGAWLSAGGLLAYPTETVWGLGADALSTDALANLHQWKGRDDGAPVSILVADGDCLDALEFELSDHAQRLVAALWPGPLTLVLQTRTRFARGVAREDGAVGVRCSPHPVTSEIARRLRDEGVGPITATSLNLSGAPSARTAAEARKVCNEGAWAARLIEIGGVDAGGAAESTVIDATGAEPQVLRWGAVTSEDLESVLPEITFQ